MKFVALVAILPEEKEEEAITLAKENGAGSVTILRGRSIGLKEKKIFFGLTLEENVTLLLFTLPVKISMKVIKSLKEKFDLENPENDFMAFTIPLSHVAGLNENELEKFENDIKNIL